MRRRGELIPDPEGDELPDLAAARALALDILRDMLRDMLRLPHVYGFPGEWQHNVFVITDETGAVVAEVPYDTVV